MRTRKQKIFLVAKIVVAFALLAIIGIFSFREALLQQIIAKSRKKTNILIK